MNTFFYLLEIFDEVLWGYIGVPAIILLGGYLTLSSNFFQIRAFPFAIRTFMSFLVKKEKQATGVHPLKVFFACVGGCVGVGNMVGICTAIQIGGPGALFWVWITAIMGMIVKYAEVYLGIRYRVSDGKGGYLGGPMYFIQQATSKKWVPILICALLSIYGVEVYQFSVITESITNNFDISKSLVATVLVLMVIFAGHGGIQRVGKISSVVIPLFLAMYLGMGIWVLIKNYSVIPGAIAEVFSTAFTSNSALGGLVGSSIILTISQGVRRGCYTCDVGVGYASVIHSESSVDSAEKQASLVIIDIFLDTFVICTMSVLMILVTGVWKEPMEAGMLVQTIFGKYFPYMHYFMPLLILLLGFSTIIAYFIVGLKCAEFICGKKGRICFYLYSVVALVLSAFVDTSQAQMVMSVSGGLLLLINVWGIFCLRKDIFYSKEKEYQVQLSS